LRVKPGENWLAEHCCDITHAPSLRDAALAATGTAAAFASFAAFSDAASRAQAEATSDSALVSCSALLFIAATSDCAFAFTAAASASALDLQRRGVGLRLRLQCRGFGFGPCADRVRVRGFRARHLLRGLRAQRDRLGLRLGLHARALGFRLRAERRGVGVRASADGVGIGHRRALLGEQARLLGGGEIGLELRLRRIGLRDLNLGGARRADPALLPADANGDREERERGERDRNDGGPAPRRLAASTALRNGWPAPDTLNARIGREMFLSSCSPMSWKPRSSLPVIWS
jgi:hypothetical protein